jgi:general secretion pathway protein H
MAVIALGTAGVALAMRDSGHTLIEREATRLAALLDAARSQSRATGTLVSWEATLDDSNQSVMRWSGLSHQAPLPTHWLNTQTRVLGNARLVLGPDPVMTPQSVQLAIGSDSRLVASDGVGLFGVQQVTSP